MGSGSESSVFDLSFAHWILGGVRLFRAGNERVSYLRHLFEGTTVAPAPASMRQEPCTPAPITTTSAGSILRQILDRGFEPFIGPCPLSYAIFCVTNKPFDVKFARKYRQAALKVGGDLILPSVRHF